MARTKQTARKVTDIVSLRCILRHAKIHGLVQPFTSRQMALIQNDEEAKAIYEQIMEKAKQSNNTSSQPVASSSSSPSPDKQGQNNSARKARDMAKKDKIKGYLDKLVMMDGVVKTAKWMTVYKEADRPKRMNLSQPHYQRFCSMTSNDPDQLDINSKFFANYLISAVVAFLNNRGQGNRLMQLARKKKLRPPTLSVLCIINVKKKEFPPLKKPIPSRFIQAQLAPTRTDWPTQQIQPSTQRTL